MVREEWGRVIDTAATVIKHTKALPYNYAEAGPRGMELLEDALLRKLGGRWPTYEEVKSFSTEHGGIRCRMFGFAAVDLFRERGIAANLIIITDRTGISNKSHALVNYSENLWIEPQTGRRGALNTGEGWDGFCSFYGGLFKIDPSNLLVRCEISSDPRPGFSRRKEVTQKDVNI